MRGARTEGRPASIRGRATVSKTREQGVVSSTTERASRYRSLAAWENPEGRGPGLRLYLAPTFVEGESLAARLARGHLSEEEALELTPRVLRILACLQERSAVVLHRDIKPANFMCRSDGSVGLVDFESYRSISANARRRHVRRFSEYVLVEAKTRRRRNYSSVGGSASSSRAAWA
jgi:serine/threonine protein kinase